MSNPSEDAEVIFNKANVALARSQRLIESWLGPEAGHASSGGNLWEEGEDDDNDFKPEPETLGVGAKAPDSDVGFGLKRKQPSTSNDKLLEQLLGKKAAREHQAKMAAQRMSKQQASSKDSPVSKAAKPTEIEDDSEEEEGRASAFRSKASRKRPLPRPPPTENDAADESQSEDEAGKATRGGKVKAAPKASKARGGTYLDQILAEKASKKRKKAK
ncbi:hypothetical protein C1H76_2233 [Elsinoe australis]|uniref:Uncharacterized protein n=1 Tax=Elsinoe australis TaxID=40998 RepID=A0A4U7B2V5_9PEZI|nr:hypothetical protein C1H76_2233 [Elsinoe australis]